MTFEQERVLKEITASLMYADNMGDVHEQVDRLHDLLGLPRPKGDYLDGWTDEDRRNLDLDESAR